MNQRIEIAFDVTVNSGLYRFTFPYQSQADDCLNALQQFSDQINHMKVTLIKQQQAQQESTVDNMSTD
jgi:hypothetical protein